MRPLEFAGQLNVSIPNGWGIVRSITDLMMKFPDGKYVLVKDPNKVKLWNVSYAMLTTTQPVMRLYSVPMSAFTGEDEPEEDDGNEVEGRRPLGTGGGGIRAASR